ncbi:hypothetical protein DO97_08035 [Neosynechococcus sphagnicola sy1]|uniref:Uncharacterized protein n=2 Tax=Neosynechococcus TaxID=1501143 RepID=A0A098TNT4_9CYAN|nr:hypothetical protein DO97_08035 [Neosynechococcus sphagnicola sy1]
MVGLRIPRELVARLDAIVEQQNQQNQRSNRSQIILSAIAAYLEQLEAATSDAPTTAELTQTVKILETQLNQLTHLVHTDLLKRLTWLEIETSKLHGVLLSHQGSFPLGAPIHPPRPEFDPTEDEPDEILWDFLQS